MRLRGSSRPAALGLLLVLALGLVPQFPSRAHAELLRSMPEANAVLAFGPAVVDLFFSEPVELTFTRVSVLSASGARMDVGALRQDPADPSHVSIPLRSLAPAIYTVSWQALSAIDGHVTSGAFGFAVGQSPDGEIGQFAGPAAASSHADQVPRWLIYLSLLALAGGPVFRALVWDPARSAARRHGLEVADIPAAWREVQGISLVVFLGSGAALFLLQAGAAAGGTFALPWSAEASSFLLTTRHGALWAGRFLVAFVVAGLFLRQRLTPDGWAANLLPGLLLLSLTLGGHAAAVSEPLLPVLTDWIHLCAAAIWLGGLGHFLLGLQQMPLKSERDSVRFVAELIPRFSTVALPIVGVIVATGLSQALGRVGTLQAVTSTSYGLTLLFKTAIFLPMLALGAVNLLWVRPRMTRASRAGTGEIRVADFARNVLYESALAAGLLLAVSMLVTTAPAVTIRSGPQIRQTAVVDDLEMVLRVTPGRAGINQFVLELKAAGGVGQVREVSVEISPEGSLEPPIIVALEPCPQSACEGATTEAYTGSSPGLRAAGRWRLRVAVRRTGEFDAIHTFGLEILSTLPRATDWSRVSLGFLLLGAVASRWALVGWKERGGIGQMLRWTPSAAMGALSLALLILPPTRGPADLVNPVPPTPDSVGRGAELYTQSCSLCHGPQGKGDGPVGVTLNPRPADLTLHTAPGVHSDGQLYLWISDGFPNSPMPAFRETISDEDRWNLVNYIRTLPQPTPFP